MHLSKRWKAGKVSQAPHHPTTSPLTRLSVMRAALDVFTNEPNVHPGFLANKNVVSISPQPSLDPLTDDRSCRRPCRRIMPLRRTAWEEE
jgi:hypothetical protein